MNLLAKSKMILVTVFFFLLCVSCSKDYKQQLFLGYIEGEYTYISSGASGILTQLNVSRLQYVHKGDLLYILDQQPEEAIVQAAEAKVKQADDMVAVAKIDYDRQKQLYTNTNSNKSILDKSRKIYEAKQKTLEIAQAELAKSKWALQQKTVYAPISGEVINTFFRLGERVMANESVLALLNPDNFKVIFYIPENQLSTIKLGQNISFTCDNCQKIKNIAIDYISSEPEFTPPVSYSKEERYKLVYLVSAKIPGKIARNFHPGQPVQVFIHE